MLLTIAVILMVLWLFAQGMGAAAWALGWILYLLPLIALVLLIVWFVQWMTARRGL